MHRPLAVRVASPLLAATMALLGSASLGANAMPAPAAVHSAFGSEQAAPVLGQLGATASVIGLAAQSLGWAGTSWTPGPAATVTATAIPTPTTAPTRPATTTATTTAAVWWSRYHGTNHVWMPSLGVSKPITFYACSQTTYPANVVYRWGCGGTNNVYLFGHNFGVFNPLYEAWLSGRLRAGMPVVYADGQGRTRLYRVTTWRVVSPTDAAWAIASQSRPSMTLQTCANAAGTTRLVVRLVVAAQ